MLANKKPESSSKDKFLSVGKKSQLPDRGFQAGHGRHVQYSSLQTRVEKSARRMMKGDMSSSPVLAKLVKKGAAEHREDLGYVCLKAFCGTAMGFQTASQTSPCS